MMDLIKAVRSHALANYDRDGWDYVVEAYSDAELETLIATDKAKTPAEAIMAVGRVVGMRDDYRKDIQGA